MHVSNLFSIIHQLNFACSWKPTFFIGMKSFIEVMLVKKKNSTFEMFTYRRFDIFLGSFMNTTLALKPLLYGECFPCQLCSWYCSTIYGCYKMAQTTEASELKCSVLHQYWNVNKRNCSNLCKPLELDQTRSNLAYSSKKS